MKKSFSLLCFAILAVAMSPSGARGGPPFFTDDPVPVDIHNWEFYFASQHFITGDAVSGTLPHFEVNYGAVKNVQLHLIIPMAYAKPKGLPFQYGPGDIEVGIKFRFVGETRSSPQIGAFPHIEMPAGSSGRGLGGGRVQVFLPIWLQKSWGAWTTYGGGGYWINPGPGNKNYWMLGWEAQRDLSKRITVGAEVISNSSKALGDSGETAFNLGALLSVGKGQILMFSAGRDLHGPNRLFAYVAYYWTWGPSG
ncbi:MAG: hypothetical protein ABSG19_11320 [Candidatus Aminicenantales bacterium]